MPMKISGTIGARGRPMSVVAKAKVRLRPLRTFEHPEAGVAGLRRAKVVRFGSSWAIRLPADFRFRCNTVFIYRDELTGDMTISEIAVRDGWESFFKLRDALPAPDDYLRERPMNRPPKQGGVFDDWED